MSKIILLNKPFGVLCQFTDHLERKTLADLLPPDAACGFYPAGRLDLDSEGLVLLTNDGNLQHRIAHPLFKLPKTYWVQVEGKCTKSAIDLLRRGIKLADGPTAPARVALLAAPDTWPRIPPVRTRKNKPTTWLKITLSEGRNRQVRRMTAAVGFPTLRLIRYAIGHWQIDGLEPAQYRWETIHLPESLRLKNSRQASTITFEPRNRR